MCCVLNNVVSDPHRGRTVACVLVNVVSMDCVLGNVVSITQRPIEREREAEHWIVVNDEHAVVVL